MVSLSQKPFTCTVHVRSWPNALKASEHKHTTSCWIWMDGSNKVIKGWHQLIFIRGHISSFLMIKGGGQNCKNNEFAGIQWTYLWMFLMLWSEDVIWFGHFLEGGGGAIYTRTNAQPSPSKSAPEPTPKHTLHNTGNKLSIRGITNHVKNKGLLNSDFSEGGKWHLT